MQLEESPLVHNSLPDRRRKIRIVGADVSELRATGLLATAGFDITVLETRDRIGGRIDQSSRSGLPTDLGASWMRGAQGKPIVDLAEKARSAAVACAAVESICDSRGTRLSIDMARHYYEEVWDILDIVMDTSRKEPHRSLALRR